MLSNKWTFSLASFVMVIAFGLAIYAPSVMADEVFFDMTLTPAETMVDVSFDAGMQVASGRHRGARELPDRADRQATLITLLITSTQVVNLAGPRNRSD